VASLRTLSSAKPPPAPEDPPQSRRGRGSDLPNPLRPRPELIRDGVDPAPLLGELERLGSCRVVPDARDASGPPDLISWTAILTTGSRAFDAVRDVFLFVDDRCDLSIDLVDDGAAPRRR